MMDAIFAGRRVVVCVGTGGVGKTTVSAAIALAAAASGRRTLVMTIDPARRLASALGLTDLGNRPYEIPQSAFAPYGVSLKAPLWALIPDVKSTFDELVARYAANDAQRRAILGNVIYREFASHLAGSLEFAAVEQLHALHSSGKYDLIVLDTPPSQSVVEFLTAPARVVTFLEQDTVRWILKPYVLAGRVSLRLVNLGSALISRSLRHLAGAETLSAIAEFLLAFHGMFDGFRERAQRVGALLASDDLAFTLVGTARGPGLEAMTRFHSALTAAGFAVRAVVLNRMHVAPYPAAAAASVPERLAAAIADSDDATAALSALAEEALLARDDATTRGALAREMGDVPIIELPELPSDAHDIGSLVQLHHHFLSPTIEVDRRVEGSG